MKKIFSARIVVALIALIVFGVYFVLNISDFKILLDVNIIWLFAIAIFMILGTVINGVFMKLILEPFDKYISFVEGFYITLISSVGNFFAPAGSGFGFRAIYLKKKHSLDYSHYLSILSGNYILVFLVTSFFGLVSLYLIHDKTNSRLTFAGFIFFAILVSSMLVMFLRLPSVKTTSKNSTIIRGINVYNSAIKGWAMIAHNKKYVSKLCVLVLMNFFCAIAITKAELNALNLSIGLGEIMLLSVLGSFSVFINITPANIGVKETVYIFMSDVIGLSVPQLLSMALIERGVFFVVLAISWIYTDNLKRRFQDI